MSSGAEVSLCEYQSLLVHVAHIGITADALQSKQLSTSHVTCDKEKKWRNTEIRVLQCFAHFHLNPWSPGVVQY